MKFPELFESEIYPHQRVVKEEAMANPQDTIKKFAAEQKEYADSPEGWHQDLQLDIADLIIERVNETDCDIGELSKKAGVPKSYIEGLIYGEEDLDMRKISSILFLLDVKPKIVRNEEDSMEYEKPDWAVKQITRASGLVEDICEHGVGHPNQEWLDKHDPSRKTGISIHGCDGCCCGPQEDSE